MLLRTRPAVLVSGLVCAVVLGLAVASTVTGLGQHGAGLGEGMPLSRSQSSSQEGLADDTQISRRLHGSRPLTWVFVGDSITHGVGTDGWRSFVEHFGERVRTELGRVDDVVINTGISGNRTEDVLAGFDTRVRRFHPDVVVVMLGTNDSVDGVPGLGTFGEYLGRIVAQVRRIGALPVLQVPPPVDVSAAQERDELARYADVVCGVADARHVVLVDHRAHWMQAGGGQAPLRWLGDDIHPNGRGHLEMARTIFRRLHILDPGSPTGAARWAEQTPLRAEGLSGHG
jgi:acyl-CoA thioesterase I